MMAKVSFVYAAATGWNGDKKEVQKIQTLKKKVKQKLLENISRY